MLQAEKNNIDPEELVKQMQTKHKEELDAYSISVDNFYTTHSKENKTYPVQYIILLKMLDILRKRNHKLMMKKKACSCQLDT